MSQDREQKSGSDGLRWLSLTVLTVVVPVLYVLSIGPVGAATKSSKTNTRNTMKVIYYPVILLHEYTPLKIPLEDYCHLWGFE